MVLCSYDSIRESFVIMFGEVGKCSCKNSTNFATQCFPFDKLLNLVIRQFVGDLVS